MVDIFFPHCVSGLRFLPYNGSIIHWSLNIFCFQAEKAGRRIKPSPEVAHLSSAHLLPRTVLTGGNIRPYLNTRELEDAEPG